MVKKLLMTAVFGLAGLAAFAGTCAVTHISLVTTDGSHKTFAGQLDNTSGVNILQHNFVIAFLNSSNSVVETKTVSGCLRSAQNGKTDFFSATSSNAASGISTGLARIAFDGTFKVGSTSAQDVTISNINAKRTNASPSVLTVSGTVKNVSSTKLFEPNVCVVIRTSAGNVLITGIDTSLVTLDQNATDTFSVNITIPNDNTASTADVWVDGLDADGKPTSPESSTGTNISACPATSTVTNTPLSTNTSTSTPTVTNTATATPTSTTTPPASTNTPTTPTKTPTNVPC